MELPVIDLTIDDFDFDRVDAIALVDVPAIQRNFMAFNAQIKGHKFLTQDSEKRIIAGPLMVADFPIYRNMDGQEFYVKFTAPVIEQIVNKFMKEGRISAFNRMHNEKDMVKDVFIQQSFIIDSTKGINTPSGFEPLPDGSWFAYVKVDNDEVWNEYIKTGVFKGFSVEGSFSEKNNKFNIMKVTEKLQKQLEKLEKFFASFNEDVQAGMAKLADGTEIKIEGEMMEGSPVYSADGQPLADGEYTLDNGSVVVCQGGVIAAVRTPEPDGDAAAAATPAFETQLKELTEKYDAAIAEIKGLIEANKPAEPKDFSSDIKALQDSNKEMFETIKTMIEQKEISETAKDKFRATDNLTAVQKNFMAKLKK